MRVGVNTLFYIPTEVGGTETILCETLNAIARYHPDVQLHLFTNSENDPVLRTKLVGNSQVYFERFNFRATNRFERILREQLELPLRAREAAIDVLWSPGYTAPVRLSCPQVVSVPDLQYQTHPEDFNPFARCATHFLVKSACKNSDLIVTLSEFSKHEIVKRFQVEESQIHVSYCGVDPAFSALQLDPGIFGEIVVNLLSRGRPYILCVSNSYPHKNLPCLVEAFEKILDQIPHDLLIIGRPRRGEAALLRAISRIPEGRILRFHHFYKEQLIPLYQNADAFVFPSLYEGFGLPVLEAMMAGVPVIALRQAAIPEIGGDCITYIDRADPQLLGDAIRELLASGNSKNNGMIERARKRAESFSWKNSAETVVACFKRVLAAGSRTRNEPKEVHPLLHQQ